jgi:hypothetical protein
VTLAMQRFNLCLAETSPDILGCFQLSIFASPWFSGGPVVAAALQLLDYELFDVCIWSSLNPYTLWLRQIPFLEAQY